MSVELCTVCGCTHKNTRRDICKSCQEAMCKVMREANATALDNLFTKLKEVTQ